MLITKGSSNRGSKRVPAPAITPQATGLGVMLGVLEEGGEWSVAGIPFLVGCVLLGIGLSMNRRARRQRS